MSLKNSTLIANTTSIIQDKMNSTNITKNITDYIHKALRYSLPSYNATTEELNMALGDTIPINFGELTVTKKMLQSLVLILAIFIIFTAITNELALRCNKEKFTTSSNPITWAMKKYREYKKEKQTIPLYRPRKAKESPFVTPEIPKILPKCPKLDGAEKGQNILFSYRLPYSTAAYRRFPSSEKLESEDEHRITITTIVERAALATSEAK